MSKSWIISQTRLKTPSRLSKLKGISRDRKGNEQFPFTPTLVKALGIEHLPEVQEMLKKRKQLIEQKEKEINIQLGNDLKLRPYQDCDVNFISKLKSRGVFNQQRTGKTPVTLISLNVREEKKNLIVVSTSLMVKWAKEYKRWNGGKVIYMKGHWGPKKREEIYKQMDNETTIITSYRKVQLDMALLKKYVKSFDAIVLDEAHMLRNFKGNRNKTTPPLTKGIIEARKMCRGAYALTGTPAPNYSWNVFGIWHFLFPTLFTSYWQFLEYYFDFEETEYRVRGGFGKIETSKKPIGFKDRQKELEFAEFMELIAIQRKRKDVMKWIPDTDVEVLELEMYPKQKQLYNKLVQKMEVEHVIVQGTLDLRTRLKQITIDPTLIDLKSKSIKKNFILDYIKDHPNVPMVIVSTATSFLKILQEELDAPLMYSGTSSVGRDKLEAGFQRGDFDILLGNIIVIKEGFTLSRGEVMIFVDESDVYEDNNQCADRILPTTEEEAIKKEGQLIIKLHALDSFDGPQSQLLKLKKSSVEIANNFAKYIERIKGVK